MKKDVLTNWERVKEDEEYCANYIAKHDPADSREISQYYNYGIFRELSEKHDVCSRAVKELYILILIT